MTVSHTIWLAAAQGNIPAPASPLHAVVPLELPEVLPLLEPLVPPELDVPDPLLLVPDPLLDVPEPPELPEVPPEELAPVEPPLLEPPDEPLPLELVPPEPPDEPPPELVLESGPPLEELSPQPIAAATMTSEKEIRRRYVDMRRSSRGHRASGRPQTIPATSSHTMVLWSSGLTDSPPRTQFSARVERRDRNGLHRHHCFRK
jgi:hypothetical protein